MELSVISELALGASAQSTTRVLLVSEHKRDHLRITHILGAISARQYELTWCADLSHALEAMLSQIHDVVLLDYAPESAPDEGRRLLHAANQHGCTEPVIVLTDSLDPQVDQEIIRAGAADYLTKTQLDTRVLERAIRYALDRKEAELKLARLAHYDALSGVPNRVLFKDRLERAIQRAERGHQGVALLFLDFDGFKAVNDTYGHDAGDRLIELIGERLSACMRKTDSVARLGGDEFTVVLEDINSRADIINVAKKIIRTVAKPFPIMGNQIVAGCSIGIAPYPEAGTDFDTLLKHADTAMYQAKDIQGSAYKFYSDQMGTDTEDHGKLEDELKAASRNSEWQLHFQPRVNLASRKIDGVECLLRWQHPQRGLLKPESFLQMARDTGQILQIGYWVLHEACQVLRKLDDLGYPAMNVAVNVSAAQLQDPSFANTLSQIIQQSGIQATRLEIEVAEPELMEQTEEKLQCMLTVHKIGPSFTLDDFGTGFSSFPKLQKLPISAVKIDHSLVQKILESEADQRVVKAMINMARSLELNVIAEGAEQIEQVRFLKQQQCQSMQGHYFSEAVPFDALCQLLNAKVLLAV
ncbi:MAG: putative bifunctional diguanylate cyclase/phosphodiesterase [Pseudomonadales bacterium]